MTKRELQDIEDFLRDKDNSDSAIEVLERAWSWLRNKYHIEGRKKLSSYDKNL